MTYISNTFKEFKNQLGLSTAAQKYLFSTDQYGNILFYYYDIDGQTVTYAPEIEERTSTLKYDGFPDQIHHADKVPYIVKRLANPTPNKKGKINKYINPTGVENQIYVSAFYALFLHAKLAKFSLNRHTKLVVVEGQKKALALCLQGIPAIGITGLTGALIRKKDSPAPTLKPELLEIIKKYNFTALEYMQDNDNLANADNLQRANQFKNATARMFQAAHAVGLNFSFSFPLLPTYKGIDDLLTAKDIDKTEVLKELSATTGKRPKFVQRHLLNSYQDLEDIEQLILRSSNAYRPLLPDAQNIDHWRTKSGFLDKAPIEELLRTMLYYDESLFNVLQVPTGTGKSTATILAMQQLLLQLKDAVFLVLVPYHLLNKKFITEFKKLGVNLNNYNETKELKKGIINIAVFDQLAEMSRPELEQINLVAVDEIDRLYNEISYRKALAIVEYRLQQLNTIGLSATPAFSPMFADNLFKMSVKKKPQLKLLKIVDRQHAVINQCELLLKSGATGLVRINDAKECILIRYFLREKYPNKKISFVCSDNNKLADEQDIQTKKAILKGHLDCDLVISTSCLDCGVSIIDGIDTVICVNEYDTKTLRQVQARSRITQSNVSLLHSNETATAAPPPALEAMAHVMTDKAEKLAAYYNTQITLDATDTGKITQLAFKDNKLVEFDNISRKYFANRCEIAKSLNAAMTNYYCQNFPAFKLELSKHFEIIEVGNDNSTGEKMKYERDETPIKTAIEEGTLQPDKASTPLALFWLSVKKKLNHFLGENHKDNNLLLYGSQASATAKVRSLKNYFRLMEYRETKQAESAAVEQDLITQNEIVKALDLDNNFKSQQPLPAVEMLEQVQQYFRDRKRDAAKKIKESANWSAKEINETGYQKYYDYLARPHSFNMTKNQFTNFLNLLFITKKSKSTIDGVRAWRWSIEGLKTADYQSYKDRNAAAAKREEEELQSEISQALEKAQLYAQIKPKAAPEINTLNKLDKRLITCPKPSFIVYKQDTDTSQQTKQTIRRAKYSKQAPPLRIVPKRPNLGALDSRSSSSRSVTAPAAPPPVLRHHIKNLRYAKNQSASHDRGRSQSSY